MQFCSVYDLPRLCLVLMLSVCSAADLQWGPWIWCRGCFVSWSHSTAHVFTPLSLHLMDGPESWWRWETNNRWGWWSAVPAVVWARDTNGISRQVRMVVSWCGWWRVEECELGCYLSTVPISRHSPAATSPANTRTLSNTGPGFCDEISTFLKLIISSHVNFFWCLALCLDNCFRRWPHKCSEKVRPLLYQYL